MELLNKAELKTLLSNGRSPCISVYMPTHRNQEDLIRCKNLLTEAEERLLARGVTGPAVRELLADARRWVGEPDFWRSPGEGLAMFLAPGLSRHYRLPLRFKDLVVVADHFHTKPLLSLPGDGNRFFVLAISQKKVRLLQGSPHAVQEMDLKGMPTSLAEALRFHDRDEPLMFHGRPSGGGWGAIFHGQGAGIDTYKEDLLLYFRHIDRGLTELLRNERAPLVLASVEFLWPIYRQANTYNHLLDYGLAGHPDRLSARELHERAWALVEPIFAEERKRTAALYAQLAGTGRTAHDIAEVVNAAHQGRIEILFVADKPEVWGKFDAASGAVTPHQPAQAGDEDLADCAARSTLLHGGKVHVVSEGEVPGGGYLAAIFWRPHARKEK